MRWKIHLPTIVIATVSAVAIAWLWRDNRQLRRELRARPGQASANAEANVRGAAEADDGANDPTGGGDRRRARDPAAVLGALGKALSGAGRASADDPDAGVESRASRRARRQRFIQTLLGRGANESEEQYRKRVVPLVTMALTLPRDRAAEARAAFEEAAGVTPEQKRELDAALGDAYNELLLLANKSIALGDLTPYRRNPRGILAFISGTSGTVDALDARMNQVLRPDQLELIEGTEFDLVEYLAVTAPWEKANPPPPEK